MPHATPKTHPIPPLKRVLLQLPWFGFDQQSRASDLLLRSFILSHLDRVAIWKLPFLSTAAKAHQHEGHLWVRVGADTPQHKLELCKSSAAVARASRRSQKVGSWPSQKGRMQLYGPPRPLLTSGIVKPGFLESANTLALPSAPFLSRLATCLLSGCWLQHHVRRLGVLCPGHSTPAFYNNT